MVGKRNTQPFAVTDALSKSTSSPIWLTNDCCKVINQPSSV